MRLRNRRGNILLHVLVTSVVIALIAASLLRLAVMRQQVTARATKATQERRYDDAALAALVTNWNAAGMSCANNIPNYTCGPAAAVSPGTCGCTCTPSAANFPTIYTCPADGASCQISRAGSPPCQLTIQSPDMP